MADKEIKLKFEVDASQAKSELDALTKQASNMGTGDATGAATPAQGAQGADMQQNAKIAALWVASLKEVRNALQETAEILALANADLKDNATQTKEVVAAQTACTTTAKALGKAIDDLTGNTDNLIREFVGGEKILEIFDELPSLFLSAAKALQRLNTLVGQGGWENVAASIKAAAAAYKELGDNLGSVGTGMKEVNAAAKDTDLTSLHALLKELLDVTKQNANANKDRAQSEKDVTTATREKREVDTEAEEAQRLLLMSVTELRAEYARLAEEIKKAAAAGDSAKVAALQQQQASVARQLRATSKEVNINRLALFGQAQAAGQVANALSSLGSDMANFGENAKNGTLDLTSMVGALGSLTAALQAGLGPIGWAMMAVQGLAMAWNFFAQERKKAEEIERNAQKFQAEYLSARIGENMELLKKEREHNDKIYKERIAGYYKEAREQQKIDDEEKVRNAAIANKEAQDKKAAADEVARHRRALIQAEMQNASDERKKELQEELLNIDKEQRARDVAAKERQAKEAKEIAERTKTNIEELEKNLQNNKELQEFLTIKLPDVDKWHALNKEIAETSNKIGGRTNETLEKLSTERREIEDDLIAQVKKIKTDFKGGFEEALELYNTMKETGEVQKNDLEELKKKQTADDAAADAAEREAKLTREKAKNADAEADARAKRERANNAINDGLKDIEKRTKTVGSYSRREVRTRSQILRTDIERLEQRQRELRALYDANPDADRAVRENLRKQLQDVNKALGGAKGDLADLIPSLVKEIRDGIVPKDTPVAFNPKNQERVDEGFRKWGESAKRMADLLLERERWQRKADTGDEQARHRVELIDERIAKLKEKYAKNIEDANSLTVGGRAGTDFAKRQKEAEDALIAEINRRRGIYKKSNDEMEQALSNGGGASFVNGVLGATSTLTDGVSKLALELANAKTTIVNLQTKVANLEVKIKNTIR